MIKYIYPHNMKRIHVLNEFATDSLRRRIPNSNAVVAYCKKQIPKDTSNILSIFQKIDNICEACNIRARKALAVKASLDELYFHKTGLNESLNITLTWTREFDEIANTFDKAKLLTSKNKYKKYFSNEQIQQSKKFRGQPKR